MAQLKNLSFTLFDYFDCGTSHLAHQFLGYVKTGQRLRYGRLLHEVLAEINRMIRRGEDPDPEAIRKLIDERPWSLKDKIDARQSCNWYTGEMVGMRIYDVERVAPFEIAGQKWVYKADCVRLNPDEGRLKIDEFKSGWVPDSEEAYSLMQLRIQALGAHKIFKLDELDSIMWSFSGEYRSKVSWRIADLIATEEFLEPEAKKLLSAHDFLLRQPRHRWKKFLFKEPFLPSLNALCDYCTLRWGCKLFQEQFWWSHKDSKIIRGRSMIDVVDKMTLSHRILERYLKLHKPRLIAEILNQGKNAQISHGGFTAWVKQEKRHEKARKPKDYTVKKLMIRKDLPCDKRARLLEGTNVFGKGNLKNSGLKGAMVVLSSARPVEEKAERSGKGKLRKGKPTSSSKGSTGAMTGVGKRTRKTAKGRGKAGRNAGSATRKRRAK